VGIRCADHVTPLYPQKLALTSPTGGGRSVGIVHSRTKVTQFSFSNRLIPLSGFGLYASLLSSFLSFILCSDFVILRLIVIVGHSVVLFT
jgi:hypothetical protein